VLNIPIIGGQIAPFVTLFGMTARTYTFVLALALCFAAALVLLVTPRKGRAAAANALLLALALGIAAARIEYVLLHPEAFGAGGQNVLDIASGGLGWHGAALGALTGLWLGARLGRVEVALWRRWLSALAFGLPFIVFAAWYGCAASGCAYGAEVRTLADYAPRVAAELPDIYNIVVPRWNTPLYGVALAALLLCVVALWRCGEGRRGLNTASAFWLALALLALGMFAIGYARADAVLTLAGLRGDQVLDLGVFAGSVVMMYRTIRKSVFRGKEGKR
jgi:prolipoprotein diacylglyceryltransferase